MRLLLLTCGLVVALAPSLRAQPGTPDPAFGTDGRVAYLAGGDGSGNAVLPLADGGLLVGGETLQRGTVLRYAPDGTLDASFGDGGVVRLPRIQPNPINRGVVRALARDAGGGTLVLYEEVLGAQSPESGYVLRLLDDGTLDLAYGDAGVVFVEPIDRPGVTDLVALPGGGCVVLNAPIPGGETNTPFVLQLRADGTPDPAFGTNGVAAITSPALRDETSFRALARYPDGRLALVGFRLTTFFNFEAVVFQLTADGAPDPAFGAGDLVAFGALDQFSYLLGAAVDAAGRLAVTGFAGNDAQTRILVGRLLDDGTPDPAFDDDGFRLDPRGALATGFDLAAQADGRLVVAGALGNVQDPTAFVARYTDDGKRDASFGLDMGLTELPFDEASIARAVALRASGEIVTAGSLQERNTGNPAGVPIGVTAAQLRNDGLPTAGEAPVAAASGLEVGVPVPQPASSSTRLSVRGATGVVRVDAFDALGRRIATVHDGPVAAEGIRVEVSGWPPGLYLLRLTDGRTTATQRLVRR